MFVIKVNDEKHFFHNSIKDDFLRYVPMHFGVEQKDIQGVWFLPDSLKRRQIEIWMQGEGRAIDMSEDGYLWKTEVFPNEIAPERVERIELTRLQKWPYDEKTGRFLGI